jgi:tetratricopeptide (TPR) repeat protein
VNTSLSKIGLIYYARKEDDSALSWFDKLIRRDRKSQEAMEAIHTVKSIYTAQGKVQEMADYLASVGAAIPQAALDSIAFGIGKNHWMEQNCKSVVTDFENYIQKFPDGIFITEAAFYKGECDLKLGNTDAALAAYKIITDRNKNPFTERSLFRSSDIQFRKKNYTEAIPLFRQLEAQAEDPKNNAVAKLGLMRSYFQLKDLANASEYAGKVLTLDKLSKEVADEAHYIIAQGLLAGQKYDEAFAEFKALSNSSKNEYGAEASYQVAYLLYLKNEYKESEKAIFDFIKSDGDYPYWVTKALILLADNYVGLQDNFQAKTTLKSIISDSDIPELIRIAQEKLDQIIAAEEAAKQVKKAEEPIKVEFDGNPGEQDKLFTDPGTTKPEGEPKNE